MAILFIIGFLFFGFIAVVVAVLAYAATSATWSGIHAAVGHFERRAEERNRRLVQSARQEPSPAEHIPNGDEVSPADESP